MESAINLNLVNEIIIRAITKDLGDNFSRVVVDTPLFEKMMQTSRANWKHEKALLKWSLVVDNEGKNTGTICFPFKGKDDEIVKIFYYSRNTGETVNVFSKQENKMVDKPVYEPIFFMDTELANKYLIAYTPEKAPFDIKSTDFSTPEVIEAEVVAE